MAKEKINPVDNTQEIEKDLRELILHNDQVNTFDFVIESLIDVCGHDACQAEQCATIAHMKGKCPVKSGSVEELRPPYNAMLSRKLTVTIN
jgi:ATP-dependent Clp protease adaptor protein ClpS